MTLRSTLILLLGILVLPVISKAQGQVFIFFDTECPICQKSSQRLQELYEKYHTNVAFKVVFSTKTLKKSAVKQFNKEYNFSVPYVIDKKHKLVEQYDAKTTPEVVLFNAQNQEVYRGAIDNQFFGLGKYRPKTTEFYLKTALEALLKGETITPNKTETVGCLINRKKAPAKIL
ncbi:redoxin domain-containing protein [Runella sp. MFBS21]|uniref:redoxin family protein n=1 Tax=Runella sp. MFBS21 TaxID=3034018 RepID=UPI0023F820EA|nr:redoxin family protein [Runella sp. MFBS21]MDF7820771.1 redoxin domain-containing protein [Runella sp. MFBS21]